MDINNISLRQEKIYNFIRSHNFVTIPDVSKALNISESTIRRDIKVLEIQGSICVFHGGVYAPLGYGSFSERITKNIKEKDMISEEAVKLVDSNDLIYIGGGSTLYKFALALSGKRGVSNITVVTSAMNVAATFLSSTIIKIIFIGGELISLDESMTSKITIDFLGKFNFDKAFIGTQAISAQQGYTLPNLELSELKKVVISHSKQVILLCDHTKIGKISPFNTCPMSDIDYLVTDHKAKDNKELEEIKKSGTKVILAS